MGEIVLCRKIPASGKKSRVKKVLQGNVCFFSSNAPGAPEHFISPGTFAPWETYAREMQKHPANQQISP